jgi:hypothetical protein
MKPLLFLTFSQLRNGVMRSLTSARRLIALIVGVSYYYFFIFRVLWNREPEVQRIGELTFPPTEIIAALVFGLFLLVTLFFWGTLWSTRGSLKPADVDMLFATPVNPKVVLLFRMARENFLALILPLMLVLFGGAAAAGGVKALFAQIPDPEVPAKMARAAVLAWILMQVSWVAAGYAYTLWAHQDRASRWAGWVGPWSFGLGAAVVAGYLAFLSRQPDVGVGDFVNAATEGPMRYLFFPATAAAEIVLAPLTRNYAAAAVSMAGFVAATALFIFLAARNVSWMYEHAALTASVVVQSRRAAATGDVTAIRIAYARAGKLKAGRRGWIARLRWRGAMGVAWRELIIGVRTSRGVYLALVVAALVFGVAASGVPVDGKADALVFPVMAVAVASIAPGLISWIASRGAYIDLLRKLDVDNALPIPIPRLLLAQSVPRNVAASLLGWIVAAAATVRHPELAQAAAAACVVALPLTFIASGTVLTMVLVFPDLEDASQRMLRELLTALLGLFAVLPGVVAGAATLALLQGKFLLASLVASLLNCGSALVLYSLAAHLYAGHNPSE